MLSGLSVIRLATVSALCVCVCCFVCCDARADEQQADKAEPVTAEQRAFVQNKVLPLLEARCFECHGGDDEQEPEGGLILTSRPTSLTGGDSGPAIVPGKPHESLLVEAIRYESFEMPPRSKMPEAEIRILVEWIKMGAPWPEDLQNTHAAAPSSADFPLEQRRSEHWAWKAIENPDPPAVTDSNWPVDPVDQFILAGLEEAGLTPAADADRRTLIRRLYFDLVGLPPTVDQVEAYVNDEADDASATAAVVDRLLASPQFGERWARHWLDLVRYAETLGHEFDYPLRHAWQYRDYVIRALNADVPYDTFIREHVAGDLLDEPRRHPSKQFNESIIATGFWHLHEDKHSPVDVMGEQAVKVDNQIDVFARTFMGLTVACARCHDHKFDAIPTRDYYSLYGVLSSSRRSTGWLDHDRQIESAAAAITSLHRQAGALLEELRQSDLESGQVAAYVHAAIEVISGQPLADEQADEDLPGTQRSLMAVAGESDCDPQLLRAWVERLLQPETQKLSDPLSLLARIAQQSKADDVADTSRQWSAEVVNAASDEGQTELFADFSSGLPEGWSTTGPAFAADSPQTAISVARTKHRTMESGFGSADLSKHFCGSLYSPRFTITHPEILLRIAGEKARVRLVINGYVMMEFNGLLFKGTDHKVDTKGEFQWLRMAEDVHRYIGQEAYLEIMDEGDGWFIVDEVRFATKKNGAPPSVDIPASSRQLAEALRSDAAADPISTTVRYSWPSLLTDGLLASSDSEQWTELEQQCREAATAAPRPVPVIAITEGTGRDGSVFIRGNHRNPGEVAPRSFLTAIAGAEQEPVTTGSGRYELADRLLADDNPFPARVAVNRLWHHLFGRGLVATTDDFGVLGARPSHPELLDHLATRFRSDDWSVKRMIRALVLSRTYRMQSTGAAKAQEVDPANNLLHRARVRRLQGEAIRDTMLLLAGRLDLTPFGKPVPVALTPFMQGRGRPKSGPLDGNGRRSIYISVNRNFLSPFMLAFDTPAPMSTRGRRNVSNVPAQALIMLNDEFAHQQAQRWANALLSQTTAADAAVQLAWKQALGRVPTADELDAILHFAQQQARQHEESYSDEAIGPQTLADVCHAVMNTKEFIYIR